MEIDILMLAAITFFVIALYQYFQRFLNPDPSFFKRKYVVPDDSKLFAFFHSNSRLFRLIGSVFVWLGLAGISVFRGDQDSKFFLLALVMACLGGLAFFVADIWMLLFQRRRTESD